MKSADPPESDGYASGNTIGLKNAIEHTPEDEPVTVTAKGGNIAAEIQITDTGEGIPEAKLPHIFEATPHRTEA